jgi:uncharacterized protein YciI
MRRFQLSLLERLPRISHIRPMKMRIIILLFAATFCASAAVEKPSPAPEASRTAAIRNQPEFDSFILVLLLRPPNAPDVPQPELDQLQEQHLANMKRLHSEGKLFKAGPTEDQSGRNVRGIFIFATDSVEKAREWVASDPLIKRGRLVAEYLKWYVEKGQLK